MDMQSLLCGIAAERLKLPRSLSLPQLQLPDIPRPSLPNLKRLRWSRDRTALGRRHLPPGTGPHTVGCVDFMSDYSSDGVFMRIYYPTQPTNVYSRETQWPLWLPCKRYGEGYCYFRRKNTKLFGTIFNWIGGDVYVPVLWQSQLLERDQPFPVVLFTHGLGGNRTTYSTHCSDIASHGFIVIAIEHRDGSASLTYCFKSPSTSACNSPPPELLSDGEEADSVGESPAPDTHDVFVQSLALQAQWMWYEKQQNEIDFDVRNKQVHMRVRELQRVVDLLESLNAGKETRNTLGLHFDLRQFKGMLDMDRLAVVGHSFGGCTAIACLAKADSRFKCAVGLDSWMLPLEDSLYDRVEGPLLLVNTETFQWRENVRDMFRLRVNWRDDPQVTRRLITIRGTCHQSQTDFQFIVPSRFGRYMEMRHTLNPAVAMQLNNQATLGFLHRHLNISGADLYEDVLNAKNPLIVMGTNLNMSASTDLD